MHSIPTITLYNIVGDAGKVTMASGDNITGTAANVSDGGFKGSGTNGAETTLRILQFHYTAIARL
jgi:hypothetical protein